MSFSWRIFAFTFFVGEFCAFSMLNWSFGIMDLGHGISLFYLLALAACAAVPPLSAIFAARFRAFGWGLMFICDAAMAGAITDTLGGIDRYQNMRSMERSSISVSHWVAYLVALHVVFVVATLMPPKRVSAD
jgi:hypothetical protein